MKNKIFFVILVIVLIVLIGCGNKLGDIDLSNVIRNINFDMTANDVRELEGKDATSKKEDDTSRYLYYENELLNGYSGEVIYRFNKKNGKLEFIKFIFDDEKQFKEYMKAFIKNNPDYEKFKGLDNTYKWDGYINDVYAALYVEYDANMLEISKE